MTLSNWLNFFSSLKGDKQTLTCLWTFQTPSIPKTFRRLYSLREMYFLLMGQVEAQTINWGKTDATVFLLDILSSSGWLNFTVNFFFSERLSLKIIWCPFTILNQNWYFPLLFYSPKSKNSTNTFIWQECNGIWKRNW